MSFAAPWGLAAAALAAPLVLWYVLRSRRPRVDVASTLLWRGMDRSAAAAVPWQRFRPDRTFWLVLAAILAGALALARPTVPAAAALGDHTILVLDTSASMAADEDGPTRLELARRQARALVDRLGPGQVVSVVEAGSRARVLLSSSSDPRAARRALDAAALGGGAADYADAFTLASSLQRPDQVTVTHLFTDGPVARPDAVSAPSGTVVDAVGRDRPNLAVTRLQTVPTGAGAAQAFVQVRSFVARPVEASVSLSLDGVVVEERIVRLAPRGTVDSVVPVPAAGEGGEGVLRATVAPADVADAADRSRVDALAGDDTAVAVLASPRRVRALVAGPGNVYVEAALAALPGVEVATAAAVPEDLSAVDLLVVDRLPAPARAQVPTLYLAPTRPPDTVRLGRPVELPAVTTTVTDHELLAEVDLTGVAVATAQRVTAPTLQPLASGPDGPLLLAGRLGPTPVVYLGFDLLASNLPLQVAWPVLMANTVTWLAGPPAATPATAGTTVTLPVPPGAEAVVVSPPAGQPTRLPPASPQLRVDVPGVWRVTYEGDAAAEAAPVAVAVNPDPGESDLARGRPQPLGSGESQRAGTPAPSSGRRVLGPSLLVIPLALLLLEWLVPPGARPRRSRTGPRHTPGRGTASAGLRRAPRRGTAGASPAQRRDVGPRAPGSAERRDEGRRGPRGGPAVGRLAAVAAGPAAGGGRRPARAAAGEARPPPGRREAPPVAALGGGSARRGGRLPGPGAGRPAVAGGRTRGRRRLPGGRLGLRRRRGSGAGVGLGGRRAGHQE